MSPLIRTIEFAREFFRVRTVRRFTRSKPTALRPVAASWSRNGGWQSRNVHSLAEAGDLCDWLDMHGITDRSFYVVDNATFVVAWR